MMLKKLFQFLDRNKLILLILIGSASLSLTMVKSGLSIGGLGFWGANGHDGIWHISLAQSFANNFGKTSFFKMPIFAGETLKNYHLGFDLILAIINKLTSISIVRLYFQIIPPILAVLIGYLTYLFVFTWRKSGTEAFWSTFFVYFGGGFGYLLGKGESAFWAQGAISTLINPPFALSLVLILLALISLLKKKYILSIFLFGILIQIKAYAGILALGGLFIYGLHGYIAKREKKGFLVFLSSLALSLILISPYLKSSGGTFVFQPFWFLETMMGLTDRVGWTKFGEAMLNYKSGGVFLKGFIAYLVALLIFWFGNAGTRFVGEFAIIGDLRKRKAGGIGLFIISVIFAGLVIPLFFLQKGTPWNTIQFFYYSLFFLGILSGIYTSSLKNILKVLIVAFTIPVSLLTLKDVYLPIRPPAILPKSELEALSFLREQEDGTVLTYPFDRTKAKEAEASPPRPLYLYESGAYVSAFSGKLVFLEDEVNLEITGYDWRARRNEIEEWHKEPNKEKARKFLETNNIKYIYWIEGQRAYLGEEQLGLTRIFENEMVDIFMVE